MYTSENSLWNCFVGKQGITQEALSRLKRYWILAFKKSGSIIAFVCLVKELHYFIDNQKYKPFQNSKAISNAVTVWHFKTPTHSGRVYFLDKALDIS